MERKLMGKRIPTGGPISQAMWKKIFLLERFSPPTEDSSNNLFDVLLRIQEDGYTNGEDVKDQWVHSINRTLKRQGFMCRLAYQPSEEQHSGYSVKMRKILAK